MDEGNVSKIRGGSFQRDGHVYRDESGRKVISVTQVFELLGLYNFDNIPKAVLERKAWIGTCVHRAMELLLQQRLDWDTVPEEAVNYTVGAEVWLKRHEFELVAAEEQGIHIVNGMRYGYQLDLRGWMMFRTQRRPVIIDLKTTVDTSPTWPIQTAAYEMPAPSVGEPYLRVILHLQPDGEVKPYFYENQQDQRTFMYMLYTALWKQQHMKEAA